MSYSELGFEKQIGDYILNELIIDGTLSKIYQATHTPTGEKVAIKVLNKAQINSNSNYYNKAQKEILIMKKMFHKNIIKLYEIMETLQRIYLVMEFCEGGDLYNYILTRGHLTERQSCRFFHDMIEALTYLHSQKIAHRDIKPENFLLDTAGKTMSIKLIDFGISNNYKDNDLLKTSCGTSAFAAPEIYKGKEYDGLLCDIWSVGVVLYAMVFGYLPFCDENEQNNIKNIMNGNYDIPDEANDDLRDLLSHLIEINPEKRMNLEQIKNHKWYNIIKDNSIPGIIVDKHKIPIDERIVNVCGAYGCEKEKIIESVSNNFYDDNTATYYIILSKFIRERYDSISDLCSQDYINYINDPNNLLSNEKNKKQDKNNNENKNEEKGNCKDNINKETIIVNGENENNNEDNEKNYNKEKNFIENNYGNDNKEINIIENDKENHNKEQSIIENIEQNNNKPESIMENYDENNNKIEPIIENNCNINKEIKKEIEKIKDSSLDKNEENRNNEKINDITISEKNKNNNIQINDCKRELNNNENDIYEIKEKKNNNEINDSTEDFQMNLMSESDQNNNVKNNNYCNDNQKNEVLSSSFSETSPKGNLDSFQNNNENNKNEKLIESLNTNVNSEKKEEKPKLKYEISKISICIESENKTNNKNQNNNENNINIIHNIKTHNQKFGIKNLLNNRKKINEKNNIKYKKNNKNEKNNEIKRNRNSSAMNRKIKTDILMDNKSFQKNKKEKNIKTKDKSSNKNKIINKNIKNNVSKVSNNRNGENKFFKPYNSVINRNNLKINNTNKNKGKYNLIRKRQFNNYSLDMTYKSYNKFKSKDQYNILNYSSYNKNTKKQDRDNSSSKLSKDKYVNSKMHLLLKSISKKKNQYQNTISFHNLKSDNSPPRAKKINFHRKILTSAGNELSSNNLNKNKQIHYYENNLSLKKSKLYQIYNSNYVFNELFTLNKSSNKNKDNKSINLNINKDNKESFIKNISKEWQKEEYNIKNKNNYNPRIYKGPVDLKLLMVSNKIDEMIKELINCLNKNEIHFKREKNNKYKFFCDKDENIFEIEIFSIYNKDIEDKSYKNIKLYYFVFIPKTKHKIILKTYLDIFNKTFIEKFRL